MAGKKYHHQNVMRIALTFLRPIPFYSHSIILSFIDFSLSHFVADENTKVVEEEFFFSP
jgi:hypothetical protein